MAEQLAAMAGAAAPAADFAGWMLHEQRRIFLLCQRMLGESDEAGSATQDAFFKAYRALERNDAPPDDAAKWLTRIAVNTCLDRLRSRRWQFWRKRPNQQDEELILAMAPSGSPDAEDRLFARQIALRLAAALDKLSARQRAVFTLRHYEDHSLEEIATVLALDVGTVKAHMARAVAKMRDELKDLYAQRRGGRQ
ncbi:MAG: RNA polymerase sigma factor [Candidatus Rokubacteria bacterium]|nr:RNA polymerase sigma factor [Candidatus Rokubacteria bacterium]